jgi:hypothetical protein
MVSKSRLNSTRNIPLGIACVAIFGGSVLRSQAAEQWRRSGQYRANDYPEVNGDCPSCKGNCICISGFGTGDANACRENCTAGHDANKCQHHCEADHDVLECKHDCRAGHDASKCESDCYAYHDLGRCTKNCTSYGLDNGTQ